MTARAVALSLAGGTFAAGLSGHSVMGLLPQMSNQLWVGPATIGRLVTIFALTYAVAAPLLAAATDRWERRRLLVASLLVTAAGNTIAALAPGYGLLAASRVVTAFGAASTTAVAVGIAGTVEHPHRQGRVIAVVLTGLSASLLVGVPAATAAADLLGYQAVLGVIAVLCAAFAGVAARLAPTVEASPALSLRARLALVGDRRAMAVLGGATLAWTGTFTVLPYLSVLAEDYADRPGVPLSVLLAGYGVGAVAGNLLGGRVADRLGPRAPMMLAVAGCAAVLLVLAPSVTTPVGAVIVMTVWGLASWAVNPAMNLWLVQVAPGRPELVALAGSAIYLGMGLGGLLGGTVLTRLGAPALPYAATAAVLAALAMLAATGPAGPGLREDLLPSRRPPMPDLASLQWPLR